MEKCNFNDVKACLKKHKPDSHKGENGCVLVIGGCEDYVSAPALSASSALRSGIDLIVVAAPEKAAYAINSFSIDFITKKLEGKYLNLKHVDMLLDFSKDFDVVLIGPGLGKRAETKAFINEFVAGCEVPIVIDADAIQQIEKQNIKGLLCPHAREFEMCFGKYPAEEIEKRINDVRNAAEKFACTVLLKGRTDVISDGSRVKINDTGNVGMTVGGTGDILSGLCAGFIAQGGSYFEAACAAAYINGLIGDFLQKRHGFGFVSSDFINLIPKAIFKHEEFIKEGKQC
ncbi:NAD(P)H-hydrate dehydratase [Candidatus Woesearchaeota archaeon]|nr:MAG: NAD(P)H-hydrate dehydratase [Candidatus Woesearchaeota archaeon]